MRIMSTLALVMRYNMLIMSTLVHVMRYNMRILSTLALVMRYNMRILSTLALVMRSINHYFLLNTSITCDYSYSSYHIVKQVNIMCVLYTTSCTVPHFC